jgi:hypothetical protein
MCAFVRGPRGHEARGAAKRGGFRRRLVAFRLLGADGALQGLRSTSTGRDGVVVVGDGAPGRRAVRDGSSRTQPPPSKGDAVLVARRAPQLRRRLQCTSFDGARHSYLDVGRRERGRRRGRDHLLSSAALRRGAARLALARAAPRRTRRGCARLRGARAGAARTSLPAARQPARRVRRGGCGRQVAQSFPIAPMLLQGSRRELYGDKRPE